MKKLLSIILCAALVLCAGCAGNSSGGDENAEASPSVSVSPEAGTGIPDNNTEAVEAPSPARDAMPEDTLLFTMDGTEVTWGDYYPWLMFTITNFKNSYGIVTDYSAELMEGMTLADYFAGSAVNTMRYYVGIEKNAADLGIVLSDEDLAEIETAFNEDMAAFESEDEFYELMDSAYGGAEHYKRMLGASILYDRCFEQQYGAEGEKLSDAEVMEYIAGSGYMMVKHILLKTSLDDGTALSDDEKAAKYAQMEGYIAELDACADTDALTAKFDEIMNSVTEDPGTANFPDGYLFQSGEMVQEFEDAAMQLGEYEYSGIVESSHGYHLILRLPIDVDTVPISYSAYMMYGMNYTLRLITAESIFSDVTSGWADNVAFETEEAFDNMDLTKVFPAE